MLSPDDFELLAWVSVLAGACGALLLQVFEVLLDAFADLTNWAHRRYFPAHLDRRIERDWARREAALERRRVRNREARKHV